MFRIGSSSPGSWSKYGACAARAPTGVGGRARAVDNQSAPVHSTYQWVTPGARSWQSVSSEKNRVNLKSFVAISTSYLYIFFFEKKILQYCFGNNVIIKTLNSMVSQNVYKMGVGGIEPCPHKIVLMRRLKCRHQEKRQNLTSTRGHSCALKPSTPVIHVTGVL